MANPLFGIKSVTQLRAEAEGHAGLKRTLGPFDLVALGIGAIIGAGLFVRTAAAAANNAGPSVTIGFIVAAVGSAFAGLCYAEFASTLPIACPVPIMAACVGAEYGSMMVLTTRSLQRDRLKSASM